ncbi:MAG: tetratricopeptide repeat protein [Pseudomonadota bacterium]
MTTCPKCHYQRVASDSAPNWQCPKCGVAYNKVGATSRPSARIKEDVVQIVEPSRNSKTMLVVLLLVSLAGFAIWKSTHSRSNASETSVSSRFDAAKKAFHAGDFEKATREFTALAEQGDAKAQYYLGRVYVLDWSSTGFNGKAASQPSDRKKSVYWYTKAAEQGELMAQVELGKLYASNLGGGTDPNGDSAKWYRMAADQGEPHAQYTMGFYCEQGRGVAKDFAQASRWYHSAAEQGHAGGFFGLGMLYAMGNGVTQNQLTAYRLLRIATIRNELDPAAAGAFWAGSRSEELAKKLSAVETTQADDLAAGWRPGTPLPR